MHFPMGRNMLGGLIGAIIGAIFAGAGWFLISREGAMFMGSIFSLVGLLVVIAALYAALNSLEVFQAGDEIRSVRRILGIPVKRSRMRRSEFIRFKKKTSAKTNSGKRHVIYYTVSAVDRNGEQMVVGEGFKGVSQADAAADLIASLFGLKVLDTANERASATEEYDYLAAD